MSERTITEAELKSTLDTTFDITRTTYKNIMDAAFPPIFKPKEGEIIVVSQLKDFSSSRIGIFCHINDYDEYVCFSEGRTKGSATVGFRYAKPQTPTQKGE
mgnify:CR=1 FL=1